MFQYDIRSCTIQKYKINLKEYKNCYVTEQIMDNHLFKQLFRTTSYFVLVEQVEFVSTFFPYFA